MTLTAALALFGAMIVLALIPGPGVFAVMAASMSSGFRTGVWMVMGILCADFIFIVLSVMGLSALAETMGGFFIVIKWLGGVYLLWLAISLWRASNDIQLPTPSGGTSKNPSVLTSFSTGLLTTLGNPKAILFYVGFFPAFLDLSSITVTTILIIMVITVVAIGGILLGYAYAASKTRQMLSSPKAHKRLHRSASGVMACSGVLLLSKS
ncbi:MAG: hypothetical protein CL693_13990 [Cellvibrionaceae bacterium]|nr:hypothetical protein [Cellvibrionaceae bacterium]|tara:strand:+ start:16715 stop:17341 length:627 start_codon:yes stop_codon:yes gene_type:complete